MQRRPRDRRPLRHRAETKTVRHGRQFQQFARDVNKIIRRVRNDEKIRVTLPVERDLDDAGRMMIVRLNMRSIHAQGSDLFQRFPPMPVAAQSCDDDRALAEGMEPTGEIERRAAERRPGRKQVPKRFTE